MVMNVAERVEELKAQAAETRRREQADHLTTEQSDHMRQEERQPFLIRRKGKQRRQRPAPRHLPHHRQGQWLHKAAAPS